jgi:hypothetical protein
VTKLTRFLSRALAAVALVATAAEARAQVTVQAPANPRVRIESGDVATLAFNVRNGASDSAVVEPQVVTPAGWRVVMEPAATVVAPGSQEVWLVSVKAPSNAAAGDYTIRVAGRRAADTTAADSAVVSIAERRGVAVNALTSLAYVMTGKGYEARFLIKNTGNVAARFDIAAKSTQGAAQLPREVFALAPGQSDTIATSVVIPTTITTTVDEALLVTATDVTTESVRAESIIQATVVPQANAGPSMWTVPAEVAIRTAAPGTGVSAFTASGSGKLTQTSDVNVDFLLRGPTGKGATFGDQETYRLALNSKLGRVRLGDQSFGFSQLLTSGARSTGAEVSSQWNGVFGGAYVQHDRTNSHAPTEASVMVGSDEMKSIAGSVVALTRTGNGSSANVVSTSGRATFGKNAVELELAASDSQRVGGQAGTVRFTGATALGSYDVGGSWASNDFAAMVRGSRDLRASFVGRKVGSMLLTGSVNSHFADPAARFGGVGQRNSLTTIAANWTNGITAEVEHMGRTDLGQAMPVDGTMKTFRVRARRSLGMFEGSLNVQSGIAASRDSAAKRMTAGMGGSVTAHLGERQFVTAFADYANGRGLGESGASSLSAGVNAEVDLRETTVRLMNTISTQSTLAAPTITSTDLAVERSIRQMTVALRARVTTMSRGATTNALFLEVKRPFGIPTAPVNAVGRARVEIVDGETGHGVAGALVRVGGQAAVTDANGFAAFRDLKPGEYRPVIDGAAVAGRVVATGGLVSISPTSRKPAEIRMSLSRGARIVAVVRSFERTAMASGSDTLQEVGTVGQVPVALVTPTDTLWQTSDDRGRVDFGSVAPGHYTVAIPRYDAPDHMALAQTGFEIDVTAGENRQVEFKLIPQARQIEFVGETMLIAAPVKAQEKPAATGTTTITGKPQVAPITGRPDEPITSKPRQRNQNQRNQKNQDPSSRQR